MLLLASFGRSAANICDKNRKRKVSCIDSGLIQADLHSFDYDILSFENILF